MTQAIDITEPAFAKAFAHPLRVEILGLLENRVASPVQIAAELGSSLSLTSYHVRKLEQFGLVKLVEQRQQRGAVAHYYTATVRPAHSDATWNAIPRFVKWALVGGRVAQAGDGDELERRGVHFSRVQLRLSEHAWEAVAGELEQTLERIEAIRAAEQEALANDPEAESLEATALMMIFESPPTSSSPESGR